MSSKFKEMFIISMVWKKSSRIVTELEWNPKHSKKYFKEVEFEFKSVGGENIMM